MNLSLLKSFSAYSFAGFFGAAASFFVLPILSHYLSVYDYGILSIFNAYVTIAIPIVGLVAAGIITIEYCKIKDQTEFASFFSSIQLIPVIPFGILSVIAVLFRSSICQLLEIPIEYAQYIYLIPLLAILTIYLETYLAYLVVKKEAKQYLIINVAKSIIEIGFTLLFIIYFDMGWMGRILSWLITTIIFTLIAIVYFQKQRLLTFNLNLKYYKAGILFGMPLILIIGCLGISFVSPFLFGWFIDNKFVGSIPYIFWITLSYCLWGFYIIFSTYIYYFNKNKYLAYLAIINVVTNLGFNYIFIKQ